MFVPLTMRYALPHDTIEGFVWGQHLEWGYDKNPWMNAWLTRLGWELGGQSGIGIYAMSSLFVGLSFWAVWELAKKVVNPIQALFSVLLLEGCIDYALVPQGFNDNVIELGLWPLMFLFFYKALQNQKIKNWVGVGISAGLAMMAKYYTAVPLALMFSFLVFEPKSRKSFLSKNLYIGFLSFALVILPHIIWLFQHDFLTLKYAFGRADDTTPNAFDFASSQLLDFLLPIVMVISLSRSRVNIREKFNTQFLLFIAVGPFLLTVALALIFRWHLYSEWGVPLVSLWGLVLVYFFNPELTPKKFKIILTIIYIIMFLWAIGYIAGLSLDSKRKHSDNYPAQQIADYVTTTWQNQYHMPLKYVAGSRYVGGYIAYYSKDHPSVFVEWNPEFSQWIDMNRMKKYGAVFVQDNYYGTLVFGQHPDTNDGLKFPQAVLKAYPNLIVLPVKYFSWHRSDGSVPRIPVLVGFLPPQPHS
ncbi:MAG: glycosyltransferase family 39 protein [Gammaproteobacteria bacterium]|nr:glycosyltransferase family 39 protein [Gammaproteobacteria bacterium]